MLGVRGTWYRVKGCSTIVPEVTWAPEERRESAGDSEGDRVGTIAWSAVDEDMYTAEARKDGGRSFTSQEQESELG